MCFQVAQMVNQSHRTILKKQRSSSSPADGKIFPSIRNPLSIIASLRFIIVIFVICLHQLMERYQLFIIVVKPFSSTFVFTSDSAHHRSFTRDTNNICFFLIPGSVCFLLSFGARIPRIVRSLRQLIEARTDALITLVWFRASLDSFIPKFMEQILCTVLNTGVARAAACKHRELSCWKDLFGKRIEEF